jgi:hypothetical protein
MMVNLEQYKTTEEIGFYKNIPIAYLSEVREHFKKEGVKIRVRYRGQRNHPLDTRIRSQRYQDCLAKYADRFSVYIAGKSNKTYSRYEPIKQPRTLYEFHKAVITTAYCYADSLEEAQKIMGSGAMFVSMRKVGE